MTNTFDNTVSDYLERAKKILKEKEMVYAGSNSPEYSEIVEVAKMIQQAEYNNFMSQPQYVYPSGYGGGGCFCPHNQAGGGGSIYEEPKVTYGGTK